MALPLLFMVGASVVRAATPAIARYLIKKGLKRATGNAAKKPVSSTVTSIKQADKLKPQAALPKPKSGNTTTLTSRPQGNVISGTAREVKVPSGGGAVKGPGTSLQNIIRVKNKPKGMKNATRNDKRITGPKPKKSNTLRNAIIAGTALGAGYLATRDGDKKLSAAGTGYSGPTPKSKPQKPSKRVNLGTVKASKVTPQTDAETKKEKPKNKKTAPAKVISAGPNTGFGPKGNIFPGSAAERAGYMKMYGGTGSAAAKAAAAGKQGDMKAGRAAVDAAKKKRLSKKKKD